MKLSKIFGLHAVQSALHYSPNKITQAWIDGRRQDQRLARAIGDLEALGIRPEKTDRKKLDRFAEGNQHQGIVIEVEMPGELPEHELKTAVQNLSAPALFLVLDHLQDPHNLGACLRTADATGVNGVIITKDNAAGITPTVCKVASGAAETVPVYEVTNLVRTLRWLKEQGLWVFGAAGDISQSA